MFSSNDPNLIDLDFKPKPMVGWFDPGQLLQTGIRALLAHLIEAYSDKREMQAALGPSGIYPYTDGEEIWIDYLADTGDGWDSTYAMACLITQAHLSLSHAGQPMDTPRGRILIMGGDQVYPTASREEYWNRLVGPYSAALPHTKKEIDLFAIPGNHDWYDGLTSFIRLFCQKRSIGALQTRQNRSYFAIQLPHRWWLWGVDCQLEADIDHPQLEYFKNAAKEMKAGDKVILVSPEPTWVHAGLQDGHSPNERNPHQNLTYLEERIIRSHEGHVVLNLAGDLHHYAHYTSTDGTRHKITSGGGGAFLHGTHPLPDAIQLPEPGSKEAKTVSYTRGALFPSADQSRSLTLGTLAFPMKNWKFSALLGGVYLLYAWLLQSASKSPSLHLQKTFMEEIFQIPISAGGGFVCGVLAKFYWALAHSPANVMMLLLIVGGLYLFCSPPPAKNKWCWRLIVGGTHGLLHVLLNVFLIWCFAHLNLAFWTVDDPRQVLAFSMEMLLLGGVAGGFLMGVYLWLTHRFLEFHAEEVFSALGIADYKNFLRLHINKDGLTVYPIGINRVPTRWQKGDSSLFKPADGEIASHCIEDPIHIPSGGKK